MAHKKKAREKEMHHKGKHHTKKEEMHHEMKHETKKAPHKKHAGRGK